MKVIFINAALIFIIILGCLGTTNADTPTSAQGKTPKVLQNKNSRVDYSFKSSEKTRYSLIDQLYQEALDKDKKLSELHNKISEQNKINQENSNDLFNYIGTNQNFWDEANDYFNQLSDSTSHKSTHQLFKDFETRFQKNMSSHNQKARQIQERKIALNDQLILLKLSITQAMMKNYEVNEKPSIESLETIIQNYDQLIEESKTFYDSPQ